MLDIAISGNAEVEATGGSVAIGAEAMASGGDLEITVSDSAAVTATSDNGVAIGSTKPGNAADDYTATNTISITSPNVTLKAAKPIATATKTTLASGTAYTVITDNGTQPVELPYGAIVDIDGVKATPATPATLATPALPAAAATPAPASGTSAATPLVPAPPRCLPLLR